MFGKLKPFLVLIVVSLLVVPINSSFVLALECPSGQHEDPVSHTCVADSTGGTSPQPSPTQQSPTPQLSPSPTGTTGDTHGCVAPAYWDGTKCATSTTGGTNQQCPSGQFWDASKNSCQPSTGGTNQPQFSPYPGGSPFPGSNQQCPQGQHSEFKDGKQSCVADQYSGGYPIGSPGAQYQPAGGCKQGEYFDFRQNKCVAQFGSTGGDAESSRCPFGEYREGDKCVPFEGGYGQGCPQGQHPDFKDGKQSCVQDREGQQEFGRQFGGCQKTQTDLESEKTTVETTCKGGTVKSGVVDNFGCLGYWCDFSGGGYFGAGKGRGGNADYYSKGAAGGQGKGPQFFGGQQRTFCEPYDEILKKAEKINEESDGKAQCKVDVEGSCSVLNCGVRSKFHEEVEKYREGPGYSEEFYKKGEQRKQSFKDRKSIEPTKKVLSALEITGVVLQMEELKVTVLDAGDRLQELAKYYEGRGDETNQLRFDKAEDKLDTAANNVDKIIDKMKDWVNVPSSGSTLTGKQIAEASNPKTTVTANQMNKIRAEIKSKVEIPIQDAAFILLGKEEEVLKAVSNEKEDIVAKDELEFQEAMEAKMHDCKPGEVKADFTPADVPSNMADKIHVSMQADVKGLVGEGDNKKCEFTIKATFPDFGAGGKFESKTYDMKCTLPEDVYAAASIEEGGEEILDNCSGSLVDQFKKEGGPGGEGPPEMVELAKELSCEGVPDKEQCIKEADVGPEALGEFCPLSAENAAKCVKVIDNFAKANPDLAAAIFPEGSEAVTQGLKYIAEGKSAEDLQQHYEQQGYPSDSSSFEPGSYGGSPGDFPGYPGQFPGKGATNGQFPSGPGEGPYPGGPQFEPGAYGGYPQGPGGASGPYPPPGGGFPGSQPPPGGSNAGAQPQPPPPV